MSNKLFFKHFIIIFIIGLFISNIPASAKEKEFEFIAPDPPASTNQSGGSLFDLLTNPAQNQPSEVPSQQWGNNPFAKQQVMEKPISKSENMPMPIIQGELYEIKAIWKTNDTYKALISGHIVRDKDQINNIRIIKIKKNKITIRHNKQRRTFELGDIFYAHEI